MIIEKTLEERGARYGVFADQADITQGIKDIMRLSNSWSDMAPDQKEALDLIANKMSRILNGDPDYHDSWHDIVGYAKLVADRLLEKAALSTDNIRFKAIEMPPSPLNSWRDYRDALDGHPV